MIHNTTQSQYSSKDATISANRSAMLFARAMKCLIVLMVVFTLAACETDDENMECIPGDKFGKGSYTTVEVPAQKEACYNACVEGTNGIAEACIEEANRDNLYAGTYRATVDERNCLTSCQLTCSENLATPFWTWAPINDSFGVEKGDRLEIDWQAGDRIRTCEPNPVQDIGTIDNFNALSYHEITKSQLSPTTNSWYPATIRTTPSVTTLLPGETLYMHISGSWDNCDVEANPKPSVSGSHPCTEELGDGLYYRLIGDGTNDSTAIHAGGTGNTRPQQRFVSNELYTDPETGEISTRQYVQIVITNVEQTSATLEFSYQDPDNNYDNNAGGYDIKLLTEGCQAIAPDYLYMKVGNGPEELLSEVRQPYIVGEEEGLLYFKIKDPDGLYANNAGSYSVDVYKSTGVTFASTLMGWVVNPIMETLYGMDCPDPSTLETQTCPESGVIYGMSNEGDLIEKNCEPGEEVMPTLSCEVGEREGGVVAKIYSNSLVAGLRTIGYAALLLYIMFYGVGISMGAVKQSGYELMLRSIKILLVLQLISDTSWGFFSHFLFNIFIDGIFDLVDMFSGIAGDSDARDFVFLDQTIGTFFEDITWKKIGALMLSGPLGLIYTAFILSAMAIFLMAVIKSILLFIFSIVAIGLMIIIFPFLFMFLLFQVTRPMFDRWISQIFGFALSPIFAFTAIIFFNEVIQMLLFGVLSFDVCWDCAWEMEIPIGELNIDICMFKAYVVSEGDASVGGLDFNNLGAFPVTFAAILAFLAVAATASHIVDIADGLARSIAGQINTAVRGGLDKAWEKSGMASLERRVNAMPQKIAKTVVRGGVNAGSKVVKGTAKSGGRLAGGAALVGIGKLMTKGRKDDDGNLKKSDTGRKTLGKRMEAYGKKEVKKGAQPGLVRGATKPIKKVGRYAKAKREEGDSKKKVAAKMFGKAAFKATILGPVVQGVGRGIKEHAGGSSKLDKRIDGATADYAQRQEQNKKDDQKLIKDLSEKNTKARGLDEKLADKHGREALDAMKEKEGARQAGRSGRPQQEKINRATAESEKYIDKMAQGDRYKESAFGRLVAQHDKTNRDN